MGRQTRRVGRQAVPLLVSVGLALLVLLGSAVLPPSGPARAEAPPQTGPAYAAEQECRDDQKPGARKGKPTGAAPSAACGSGQAGVSTGQTVSPPRRTRPSAAQAAGAGRPRSTAGQRPTGTGFTVQAAEKPGLVYVFDTRCCGNDQGAVIEVDPSKPAGQDQRVISSGQFFGNPFQGALTPDGLLYVIDNSCCGTDEEAVIRVDPSQPNGANQTVISSGQHLGNPFNIVLAPDGALYVSDRACCGTSTPAVIRVDPSQPNGANQTVVSQGQNFVQPFGMAVAPDGRIYVADADCCQGNAGGIIRVDPTGSPTNNQTIISSGDKFAFPTAVALAADGTLYVADADCCAVNTSNGAVIRVDPTRPPELSNQTIVSQGQGFLDPIDIALAADGTLWVLDAACCAGAKGALIQVDPSLPNGSNQFLISDGQNFVLPQGLAVVPQVAIADATVTEGNGGDFLAGPTVTRAPFSGLPLSVPFTTTNGTATSPADFTPTSGTVTFAAGQTSATVPIKIVGDILIEPTETFTVTLQPPNGVAVTRATATVTILDTDSACSPRPRVTTAVAPGGSGLQVFVTATPQNTGATNPLTQIQFGTLSGAANAQVTLNGSAVTDNETVTLPANTTTQMFTVRRAVAGAPTTVRFTVVDTCGSWPSFVGGGANAGF